MKQVTIHFNDRQQRIISMLFASLDYISSKAIAQHLSVSMKTVQRDLMLIADFFSMYNCKLEAKQGYGYKLQQKESLQMLPLVRTIALVLPDERTHFIIRCLLAYPSKHWTLGMFENILYSSKSTIQSEYIKARRRLQEAGIILSNRRSEGIELHAQESQIRSLLLNEYDYYINSTLIQHETRYSQQVSFEQFGHYLSLETYLHQLQQVREDFEISYANMQHLMRIIFISHARNHIPLNNCSVQYLSDSSLNIANEIAAFCECNLQIYFSQNTIYFFAQYIDGLRYYSAIAAVQHHARYSYYETLIDECIHELCDIYHFCYLQTNIFLRQSLILHIIPMLSRIHSRINIVSMDEMTIMRNGHSSVELAIDIANFLYEAKQILLSRSDIVELSVVFKPVFGQYPAMNKQRKIIIVSKMGKPFASYMKERINRNFIEYIDNVQISETYEITKIPFEHAHIMLTDLDEEQISSLSPNFVNIVHIPTYFSSRSKQLLRDIFSLKHFTYQELRNLPNSFKIYEHLDLTTKEKIFAFYAGQVGNMEAVFQALVKREKFMSQELNCNVVVVQDTCSKQQGVHIITLKKPIRWNNYTVSVIVIWSINPFSKQDVELLECGVLGGLFRQFFTNPATVLEILSNPSKNTIRTIRDKIFTIYSQ